MEDIKHGYTRVSEILNQWDRFGHINKDVLENKAAIGTRVHEAIKNHHDGMYTPLDAAASGYFDSYIKWEEENKPKLIQSEVRYYCDNMMITGQIDALVKIEGEESPVLVDYKTSAQENAKIWPLQAAFYHYLVSSSGLDISNKLIFVKLDKKGNLPKICEYTYNKTLWDICVSAWKCYKYLN